MFDNEKLPEAKNARETIAKKRKQKKKTKKLEKCHNCQNRNWSFSHVIKDHIIANRPDKNKYGPCQAYGKLSLIFKRYYLVLGKKKD